MILRPLDLYWQRVSGPGAGPEDVGLGTVYYDAIPRAGELLVHPTGHGVVWKVVTVYHQGVVQAGSATFRDFAESRKRSPLTVTLFVERVEGPFAE